MTKSAKKDLIQNIVVSMRLACPKGRDFDEGDIFFSLCFKSDSELLNIAKLAGV